LSLRLGEFARPYRGNGLRFLWLGRACATLFIAGARMSPRVYYLFPALPLLFAAGSVMYEMWLEARHRRWRRVAYRALLIAAGKEPVLCQGAARISIRLINLLGVRCVCSSSNILPFIN